MRLPINLLSGYWGYAIVALTSAISASAGTYYIVHTANAVIISNLKLDNALQAKQETEQALEKLTSYIGRMNASALDYQWYMTHIQDQFGEVNHALSLIQKQKPLPPDCKPDADRLRNLTDAIHKTNEATTIKSGIGSTVR